MAEESKLFKDLFFKPAFLKEFADAFSVAVKGFDKKKFEQKVFDKTWKDKELKQRMRHVTLVLHEFMPVHFPDAAAAIMKAVNHVHSANYTEGGFGYICLPEYIELYGLEHFKESVKTMEELTQFISCEFAVRPFIIKYGERMMKEMLRWSKHKSPKVRRLASEGCRPRLPWAIALPEFKKNPSAILPVLENMKADTDIWVRKSVANNLNDIAKDNPEVVLKLIRRWKGDSKETDWIIKHGSRTLLKQGHTEVLELFGFKKDKATVLEGFRIETPRVKNGKDLVFSFTITNKKKQADIIRLEYGMYYNRANGTLSKKVFKISEREYKPGEKYAVTRKQSFKPITTRKYYPGKHKLSIIINGHEMDCAEFTLIA